MAVSGLTAPANVVVWKRDPPPTIKLKKVETGSANVKPGALVVYGSTVGEIGLAGAGATRPIGWIGFMDTPGQYIDGHTYDTAFATGDFVSVVSGPGIGIWAILASSNTLLEGEYLVSAANGQVQQADALTVTIASGSTTVVSDKAQPDESAVGAYGSQGRIVGHAEESVTTSGSAARVMITSYL